MSEGRRASPTNPALRRAIMLGIAAALAGCAPVPGPPPPPYHALGIAPSWNLLIDEHDITFVGADQQIIRQPTPTPIHGVAGDMYRTPRIEVNLVHGRCSDTSDRVYPDRVEVRVDGRSFNGCGGL